MKFSILLQLFLVPFLFCSQSFAWNAETNCSHLKKDAELTKSYYVNFTIKASTDSNAFLKILTVIVADGSNYAYFQEGQRPTRETVLLSNVTMKPTQPSQTNSVEFQILEAPKNKTPPYQFGNLSMIEFTQKVSIVGLNLDLSEINLDCSTIETIDEK
jgi:hypothetical protein